MPNSGGSGGNQDFSGGTAAGDQDFSGGDSGVAEADNPKLVNGANTGVNNLMVGGAADKALMKTPAPSLDTEPPLFGIVDIGG